MEACCEKPENREAVESPEEERRESLTVERCTVCGRRHFELTVDPGKLGLRGGAL